MRAARAAGTKKECNSSEEDQQELRRGPWTLEEDTLLTHYIHRHGEGRWNMVAKCAGNQIHEKKKKIVHYDVCYIC